MRTFPTISDKRLVIDAIRRLRVKKVVSGGRTAPEGTDYEGLLQSLINYGLVGHDSLKKALTILLERKDILLTGHATFFEAGSGGKPKERRDGIISKLHPDARLSHLQFFTPAQSPITPRFRDGKHVLVYPTADSVDHWRLRIRRIYVTSDGIPASTMKMQKIEPIQPY